ncbi:polymorphic toxin type 30 domain-containing protein [Xenorhabdus griffiniae]|uniref:polymorphic toxin type 30 domain-containing protein n=1 Tax=Xenorhabdus griffiniae TaxID=351672 RepID=UPI0030CC3B4D
MAPAGSHASQGWVVRIMDGKKSMDINGNYHPAGIFKEGSPNFNPDIINDVHIPINKPTKFPGVD